MTRRRTVRHSLIALLATGALAAATGAVAQTTPCRTTRASTK